MNVETPAGNSKPPSSADEKVAHKPQPKSESSHNLRWENGYNVIVGKISLDGCVMHLDGLCEGSMMWNGLSSTERENIQKWRLVLTKSREEIEAILQETIHHNAADHILGEIANMMWASFNIGSRASVSKTTERWLQAKQTSKSRAEKRERIDSPNATQLREAILNTHTISKLRNGDKYADSIRQMVLEKLGSAPKGVKDGWPSTRTISRAIGKLLKEHGERSDILEECGEETRQT
ncbi:hypothetical protein [Nitrospirillum viridazoti]|uniref:Uncharacterized protein n=1 Tax=Nitrospirillum amazonense TaxID=28077 RepID=A0A560IT36_9PROT|nr:hypothetical protein [Nitrospirillum amazonense]TWB62232.1 hypothetical protein FBZ92_105167 [Nitrospirillum amazonense]